MTNFDLNTYITLPEFRDECDGKIWSNRSFSEESFIYHFSKVAAAKENNILDGYKLTLRKLSNIPDTPALKYRIKEDENYLYISCAIDVETLDEMDRETPLDAIESYINSFK